ncbi:hypothetical protein H6503_00085 [Candidatus Woesearchaeota archaeon]|nr:hypothetical protein [Candidatus Woesearchaeota archaeon]
MTNIRGLFKELKYEIFKNILVVTFLRSVIAFFIFYMFASLFDLWYVFSFLFAAAYFSVRLYKQMKRIRIKVFEEHNPEIKEMLSTAADNQDKENIVLTELFKEVIEKVRKLSSGTLIVPKEILIMIILIPILAVASFEISYFRIDALSQDKIIDGLQQIKIFDGLLGEKIDGDIIDDGLLDEDIFGEKKIAQLGDQEINIKMNLGFETDLTRPKDEDTDQIQFKDYPESDDVELIYDTSVSRENIEEDAKLARAYNEKIRNLK